MNARSKKIREAVDLAKELGLQGDPLTRQVVEADFHLTIGPNQGKPIADPCAWVSARAKIVAEIPAPVSRMKGLKKFDATVMVSADPSPD